MRPGTCPVEGARMHDTLPQLCLSARGSTPTFLRSSTTPRPPAACSLPWTRRMLTRRAQGCLLPERACTSSAGWCPPGNPGCGSAEECRQAPGPKECVSAGQRWPENPRTWYKLAFVSLLTAAQGATDRQSPAARASAPIRDQDARAASTSVSEAHITMPTRFPTGRTDTECTCSRPGPRSAPDPEPTACAGRSFSARRGAR